MNLLEDLKDYLGFAVAGNFAGHLSEAGEADEFSVIKTVEKDANVDNFVNMLYKKTRLEDTFGVNMLAIDNNRPETMGIKKIIQRNVEFQFEVTTRKYTNLLNKELERKEIQEGLIKACNVIDLIIEILRGSKDRTMEIGRASCRERV